MEDLEKILRKSKGKDQEGTSQLEISFSLSQEEILSLQDIDFDIKFEQYNLKSKSKTYLKKFVVDQNRFQSYILKSLWEYLQKTVKTQARKKIIQNLQPQVHNIVQNPPRIMDVRFAPLALQVF